MNISLNQFKDFTLIPRKYKFLGRKFYNFLCWKFEFNDNTKYYDPFKDILEEVKNQKRDCYIVTNSEIKAAEFIKNASNEYNYIIISHEEYLKRESFKTKNKEGKTTVKYKDWDKIIDHSNITFLNA